MIFKKYDMAGTHYNWELETKETPFTGQPSRRLFDRFNGNQVLFLINFLASLTERFDLQSGLYIERMIKDELPLAHKSELSVFHWISSLPVTGR